MRPYINTLPTRALDHTTRALDTRTLAGWTHNKTGNKPGGGRHKTENKEGTERLTTHRPRLTLSHTKTGNKGGQEDWKAKAVAQLLEDEKRKSAAKMGGKPGGFGV